MSIDPKKSSGLFPVLAAVTGNSIICIAKMIGFYITGSATLFAEVIHSVADIMNQLLLFVGIKRSMKEADEKHNFGYGQERFFWAVVSACGVFFIGVGVTVYHGIHALLNQHDQAEEISMIAVSLLLVSLVMEGVTLFIALKELRGNHQSFREAFKYGDTTTIAIVFEDGVALLGIIIALLALYITAETGSTFWDGIGSISVGVLLGIMAIVLVNKNRSYLIEKAMPKEKADQVIAALKALPLIDDVVSIKSTTLSIDQYKISVEVEIGGATLLHELYGENGLSAEYERIKSKDDFVRFAADYSDRLSRGMGYHLEKIEKKIKEAVPDVKQIEIEIK